ncbi:hypothetical protein ROV94_04550 [Stenotrophomonas maltophilia]|uniref:hypothetical protein n=2 Tax=Stenotrophomonas maltophilia TaxID=40324 RepID=UPI0028940AAA|nr:hypothetical protein [Stenotrophomonas maltophilia]MDT3430153.1 hypothetical protein [Stenotrophomonas maltophilia]
MRRQSATTAAMKVSASCAGAAIRSSVATQARALILQPPSSLPGTWTLAWHRGAMASGSGWAMTVSGVLALLAALGLLRQRRRA